MIIFSIETSCDDTSIAIIKTRGKNSPRFEVLANIMSSQIANHTKFGGVVPTLAARLHLENINRCIDEALNLAKIKPRQIDLITVTRGPGLIPALLIGTEVAKTLAYLWNKPVIGINHIEGHMYSNFINGGEIKFPILNLIVSGGHTSLILMKDHLKYQIVGETRDDAVGECFDKVARLMGLGYPGGPIIEKLALKYKGELIDLPRPMKYNKDYDFSFSGLKTSVLYITKEQKIDEKFRQKMSASFQDAAFDVLCYKALKATEFYQAKTLTLGGGVSANKALTTYFKAKIKSENLDINFLSPEISLSTDNAVMIAIAGYYRYISKGTKSWHKINADANLKV